MKIQKPTIGRIVEVAVYDSARERTIHRPAIVVSTDMGGSDGINVQAFMDGANDRGVSAGVSEVTTRWLTSIHHNADGVIPDGGVATWRYPPKSTDEIEV